MLLTAEWSGYIYFQHFFMNTVCWKDGSMHLCFASCNNRDKNYTGSFFRLPKATAESWFIKSRRKDITLSSITREARVCEAHFASWQLTSFITGYGEVRKCVKPGEVPYRDGEKPPLEMSGRLRRSLESPQNKISSTSSSSTSSVSNWDHNKKDIIFYQLLSFMNEMCYHSILSSFNQ